MLQKPAKKHPALRGVLGEALGKVPFDFNGFGIHEVGLALRVKSLGDNWQVEPQMRDCIASTARLAVNWSWLIAIHFLKKLPPLLLLVTAFRVAEWRCCFPLCWSPRRAIQPCNP